MKIALLALLLLTAPAFAQDALPDLAQEQRAQHLGEEIRCVVCQSENINDSQADMARDMRLLVREKIKEGQSDVQITDFLRTRYGDFILLKPPVQKNTALLWAAPILFLVIGAGLAVQLLKRRNRQF
jgi:cytochrome c-type biogenesis protein CcmH